MNGRTPDQAFIDGISLIIEPVIEEAFTG